MRAFIGIHKYTKHPVASSNTCNSLYTEVRAHACIHKLIY